LPETKLGRKITTMANSPSSDINTIPEPALKIVWNVGDNKVIVIDKSIVKRLGISEDNTLFRQEIVEGGIFLRMVRKEATF
jgi:hypothetical protein